jgi:hypothetical protein
MMLETNNWIHTKNFMTINYIQNTIGDIYFMFRLDRKTFIIRNFS